MTDAFGDCADEAGQAHRNCNDSLTPFATYHHSSRGRPIIWFDNVAGTIITLGTKLETQPTQERHPDFHNNHCGISSWVRVRVWSTAVGHDGRERPTRRPSTAVSQVSSMSQKTTQSIHETTIRRAALAGSRRVSSEGTPLFRGETSGQVEESHLEIPIPATLSRDADSVRVLHVDDNPNYGELTKTILERQDAISEVSTEENAIAAIERLRSEDFDCIVSDYDMPNTDGLDLLEIVREEHPDLPFILFTGKGGEEIASEAITAGVTDYVQKKGSTEQYEVLANRITNAVEQHRTQQCFWDALSWYQQLVTQGLAGVFVVQNGEFAFVNDRFAQLLGYEPDEMFGRSPTILDAEAASVTFTDCLQRARDSESTEAYEVTASAADGTNPSVEIHAGPVTYAGESSCLGVLWEGS